MIFIFNDWLVVFYYIIVLYKTRLCDKMKFISVVSKKMLFISRIKTDNYILT